MPPLTENLHLLTPEFALAGLAMLVFAVDLFLPESRKHWLALLSVLGLLGLAGLSVAMLQGREEALYGGLLAVDRYALVFKVFFLGLGALIILSSVDFVRRYLSHPGEFYAILLLSVLGMNVMAQARELLTAYIALELLSFSLYVLTAYARSNPKSNEAALKYIIIGAFSSAILLYGLSMVYSSLGTTYFTGISQALASHEGGPALWVGIALLVVGLGFKLAAAPFHLWAPDVYEGAPLPVTAYLAIGSKAAAFALVLRLFAEALVPAVDLWSRWQIIVAALAAVSMLVGNLVALAQRNLKRLMAYSSIAHVGFLLTGVAALAPGSTLVANGIILYLVGYAVTSVVVFAGLIAFFNHTGQEEIADLAGLADRQPLLAAALAIGLFSLSGLPIFAGFTIKFYLFTAVAQAGFLWLSALAVFASFISLYYYLQVIRQMYIQPAPGQPAPGAAPSQSHGHGHGEAAGGPPTEAPADAHAAPGEAAGLPRTSALPSPGWLLLLVLVLGLSGVFWVGLYPAPLLEIIDGASRAILPGG